MTVRVPGKLILSGEHAVVYGAPALAMAVNRYVKTRASAQLLPLISFEFADLAYQNGLTLRGLKRLKSRVYQQYQRFKRGEARIRDVLRQSHELAQFVFSLLVDTFDLRFPQGIKMQIQSDIPIGCGMGSSAAIILSVLYAIRYFLNKEIAPDTLFRLAHEAENMQHGWSSGLDLKMCLEGGALFTMNGVSESRAIADLPFYLVHTGVPSSTTGECVIAAQKYFQADKKLVHAFTEVTQTLDLALCDNHFTNIQLAIRENQKLLNRIGVVPQMIQQFIDELTRHNHAAKICGAGAVSGDRAGVIWVVTQNVDQLAALTSQYGFSLLPVQGEARGVHVI